MNAPAASTEEKALSLLGVGVSPIQVASALGVSESRISQLLASEEFSEKVAIKRFENLRSASVRDGKLDELEDSLIAKLRDSLELVMPTEHMKIARLLQIVNAAKRRGAAAIPESTMAGKQIVSLTIPSVIKQTFVTNINNQVLVAGSQELVTMNPSALLAKVGKRDENVIAAGTNGDTGNKA